MIESPPTRSRELVWELVPDESTRSAGPSLFSKVSKSLVVSAITTMLSLSVLGVLTFTDVVVAAWANVIATVVGIGPSYALNRRWVWRRTGRSSVSAEIVPFWSMCLFALVASTWTVATAARWAESNGLGDAARTVVVLAVNIATFTMLWLLQFLLLDRILFTTPTETTP